ncbi:MAG TPA: metallopeptidase family protein [Rhodoblastus sp.]|nr:metallopeptidase family protein [Rhodoblastus sp.]
MTGSADDWSERRPPTLPEFEDMAQAAFEFLPANFRRLCAGIVIRIDDWPDDETLDEMKCESDYDLLGLFRGRGLAQGEAFAHTGQQPNMVWLYRRPILDYWAENEDTLGAIVRHVLIHEIGHHFGLSDDDMERIEREAE